jgi:uncharacterized protein DUF2637
MTGTDTAIRWSTAAAVIGVAAVAAVVSYEHAYDLVRGHGERSWTAHLIPLTVDGLIWASSMVMLDSARRGVRVPALARWLLGLGIAATLAANVAHGFGHGPVGAGVAAWPAVALVGSYELLMMVVRGIQQPASYLRPGTETEPAAAPTDVRLEAEQEPAGVPDPLVLQAAEEFADDVTAGRMPSVRAIRARLHVGQPRANLVRAYLATLGEGPGAPDNSYKEARPHGQEH